MKLTDAELTTLQLAIAGAEWRGDDRVIVQPDTALSIVTELLAARATIAHQDTQLAERAAIMAQLEEK